MFGQSSARTLDYIIQNSYRKVWQCDEEHCFWWYFDLHVERSSHNINLGKNEVYQAPQKYREYDKGHL